MLRNQLERVAIEHVGAELHVARRVSGRESAVQLARRHRVDLNVVRAQQAQDREARVRLCA